MPLHPLDLQLLDQLAKISEISSSGFSVRAGLTGSGVTILKGRSYFGAWRVTAGTLVWTYANVAGTSYFASSAQDAMRHTMMMILRSLEQARAPQQGFAGAVMAR
jgi:hypothetical protein